MARDLVALKFHAGLHTEDDIARGHKVGQAKYPDFNQINASIRKGMDWCTYIDAFGISMQYDKTCGHKEHSVDSPFGQQCCVIAVPQDFATEALKMPGITKLTPAEFEAFYDGKAHAHEDAEIVDTDVLQAIKAKEDLGLAVPEKTDAVNPDHPARGIRKNTEKKWADKKLKIGVNIV